MIDEELLHGLRSLQREILILVLGRGAVIGFAGPRVIKQTLGQDLPEGFQTSEFLLEHGMLDLVVHRRDLKPTVGRLLRHMSGRPAATAWATS